MIIMKAMNWNLTYILYTKTNGKDNQIMKNCANSKLRFFWGHVNKWLLEATEVLYNVTTQVLVSNPVLKTPRC